MFARVVFEVTATGPWSKKDLYCCEEADLNL